MECTDAKPLLASLASGNLAPEASVALEEHLAKCEGCRLELELVRAMGGIGCVEADGLSEEIAPESDRPADLPPPADGPTVAEPGLALASIAPEPAVPEPLVSPVVDVPPSAPDLGAEPPGAFLDLKLGAEDTPSSSAPPEAPATSEPPVPQAARPHVTSWDFEPVEAKPSTAPPEKSLFFAEETLERQREGEGKKKGALLRRMLWIAGGLLGVAFLGLSAWIAIQVRLPSESPADERFARPALSREAPPAAAATEEAVSASLAAPGGVPSPEEPNLAPSPEPSPEPIPPAEASAPGASEPEVREPAATPKPSAASRAARRAPAPSPSVTRDRTSAQPLASPRPAPARARLPIVRVPGLLLEAEPDEPMPIPAEPAPRAAPRPDAPAAPSTESTAEPAPPPRAGGGADSLAGRVAPAPASAPSDPRAPAAGTAGESGPAASSAAVERPIDRVHQATVAAEERGDLTALRQLRDTWKSMIQKTGVGPDRARAKREYADCLWAIQTLSGRLSDQKAALTAYRDYILNAPAGGADSRSVGRARLLEDAISESR